MEQSMESMDYHGIHIEQSMESTLDLINNTNKVLFHMESMGQSMESMLDLVKQSTTSNGIHGTVHGIHGLFHMDSMTILYHSIWNPWNSPLESME